MYCPKCGFINDGSSNFCKKCGTPLRVNKQKESISHNQNHTDDDLKKKRVKRIADIAAAAAVVIIGGITLAINISKSGSSVEEPLFYFKDGALYSVELGKKEKEPVLYTDESRENLMLTVKLTEDGNYVCYPSDIRHEDGRIACDLYCKDLRKKDSEPFQIDSSVRLIYKITPNNNIIYVTGEDSDLYIHNLDERSRVASNVDGFWSDGNNILWAENVYENDSSTNLYYLKQKKQNIN